MALFSKFNPAEYLKKDIQERNEADRAKQELMKYLQMQAMQAQQAQTYTGGFGGAGGSGGYAGGGTAAGTGNSSWITQAHPTQTTGGVGHTHTLLGQPLSTPLPSPTGMVTTMRFETADGQLFVLQVDRAYLGIMEMISSLHAGYHPKNYHAGCSTTLSGDFTEDEMELAAGVMAEMESKKGDDGQVAN